MKKIKICFAVILIIASCRLYSQEPIYVGMSANEFKTKLPGILPDTMKFNDHLFMKENLRGINGSWSFGFYENTLHDASYNGICNIVNKKDFDDWIESAKEIIENYTGIYGQPVKFEKGDNQFKGRDNYEYQKTLNKREVFYDATWETKTMRIKLSCDYRSNYFEEFNENLPNGPAEWYNYSFKIDYSSLTEKKNVMPDKVGRFYLGMEVKDFAKIFPALFPKGVEMSGQWSRDQKLYGLDGSWAYDFENGKLDWFGYDKYIDEINKENFDKCLSATKKLIEDYTKYYGKPDTTMVGNTNFIDPAVKHHWGYDVMEVRWKDSKGMKIKIEFTFMGGKGDYHFLVKINFFDKDYPYYD